MAIIPIFLRGLRPELRSRLQVVEFTSLFHLMERTVNVEEGIIDEQVDLMHVEPAKLEGGINVAPPVSRLVSQGRSNNRGRQNNRGKGRNIMVSQGASSGSFVKVCY
ncbi:unnamed protein product [Arabis nemorensis]|uniref:Uncharacterized protein n=1 Tax=Arabis nemorensis TaxID=586526 RepID=A0A565BLA4_9BRAS|nr:unnamed protein product [Arabis nemorensis]